MLRALLIAILMALALAQSSKFTKAVGAPALVQVVVESETAILLDNVPSDLYDYVVNRYTTIKSDYWVEKAKRHYKFSWYYEQWRMYFDPTFVSGAQSKVGVRTQIPHTPEDTWRITLLSDTPTIKTVQYNVANGDGADVTHKYLVMPYRFTTYIITDHNSLVISEPDLNAVNTTHTDVIIVPRDPEDVLQRTGYACMDEAEFPPGSVESATAWAFWDTTCVVENPNTATSESGMYHCHFSIYPNQTCMAAADAAIGTHAMNYVFNRVQWSDSIANEYRRGNVVMDNQGGDIRVLQNRLNVQRIEYRYIPETSCALVEGCVKAAGYRRLLKFDAATLNAGSDPIHVGNITDSIFSQMYVHNVYEYSGCHNHMHFQFYANYSYGPKLGNKQAWCMESINRVYNHERVPINTDYWKCGFQGIYTGWSDEYIAGIECQWIDITETAEESIEHLGFEANPQGFLCEGIPVTDATGNYIFDPTPYKTQIGNKPIDKPRCTYRNGYGNNNYASTYYYIAPNSTLINDACLYEQIGEQRDCGWQYVSMGTCTPGRTVTVTVKLDKTATASADAQVVRVCEYSKKLQTGLACAYNSPSYLTGKTVLGSSSVLVSFTCPSGPAAFDAYGNKKTLSDNSEPGGAFSIYSAPYTSSSSYKRLTLPDLKSSATKLNSMSWIVVLCALLLMLNM
ncbi:protein-lysine 6-oxidase [Acrasis kona]|uniref:Protein-lysine 6-oxidase n=1 Tax=Acrasis kona TaxID=1008807 RepID=A0AAW2ZNK7_9EUKA